MREAGPRPCSPGYGFGSKLVGMCHDVARHACISSVPLYSRDPLLGHSKALQWPDRDRRGCNLYQHRCSSALAACGSPVPLMALFSLCNDVVILVGRFTAFHDMPHTLPFTAGSLMRLFYAPLCADLFSRCPIDRAPHPPPFLLQLMCYMLGGLPVLPTQGCEVLTAP